MKRLAQLVHAELLDAEEDDRVGAIRNTARAHRPARRLATAARISASGEDAERPLHHGMGQVHEQSVATGLEDAQTPEPLDERLRAECEPRHRTPMGAAARCKHSRTGEGGAPYGLVDDVAPTREIGPEYPVEAGLLGGLELGPAGGHGHRSLQRVAKRTVVEVDLRGHLVEKHDPVRLVLGRGDRCSVDFQGGAAATRIDPAVEVGGDRARLFALDQASMDGAVEDFR